MLVKPIAPELQYKAHDVKLPGAMSKSGMKIPILCHGCRLQVVDLVWVIQV